MHRLHHTNALLYASLLCSRQEPYSIMPLNCHMTNQCFNAKLACFAVLRGL